MTGKQGGILWLASYPKSGNTWFRAFYTNLITDGDSPAHLDALLPKTIASSRYLFDDYAGVESADLTWDEIEELRPRIYEIITRVEAPPLLIKSHDAYTRTASGEWLMPPHVTRGAIYFMRNPLDVAVSFAHHNACSIDTIINHMADESHFLNGKPNRIGTQIRQRLLSWSSHVTSWVDGMGERLHLMRYEDMLRHPRETFTAAARFGGWPDDPVRIEKALRFSDIRELQKQEQTRGFKEKSQVAPSFFRKGKTGSWREVLTDAQAARIIQDHGAVMKRFGYLNENNEPLF